MKKNDLETILKQYINFEEKEVFYQSLVLEGITLKKVKESILGLGQIITQNVEEGYIVASLTNGISAFSNATVVISVLNNEINILSYAKEGIIKQNIALKNIETIFSLLNGVKEKKSLNISNLFICVISISIVFIAINFVKYNRNYTVKSIQQSPSASPFLVQNTISPTLNNEENDNVNELQIKEQKKNLINQYNTVITNLNTIANSYNQEIKELSVVNIDNLPDELEIYEEMSDDTNKSIEEMNSILLEMSERIETSIENYFIVHKLYEMDENAITMALSALENVVDIESVTTSNDPNNLLGKNGGYVSCTYFTLDLIDIQNIPGEGVVGKGTDAGGCIELYKNVEDAMNRCEYLKDFDDTLLYSGSYVIVGKSVIRTSYLLTNEQQINITKQIVEKLISHS